MTRPKKNRPAKVPLAPKKRPAAGEAERKLLRRNEKLKARLAEAEETLRAIQAGEVDALVVSSSAGERIYTLEGADRTYRVLIEEMAEGALTLSADGIVLYCNRRFADIVGTPMETVVGSSFLSLVSPAKEGEARTLLQKALAGRIAAEISLRAGKETTVPALLAASRLPGSGPPAVCLVVSDLTERMRQEERLRESEEAFRSLVEHSLVGFFIVRDGRILFSNPEQDRIFRTKDSFGNLEEVISVHPNDREKFENLLRGEEGDGGEHAETDLRFYPKDRNGDPSALRWVHCHAIPFRHRGEKALLLNMMDITKNKEMELTEATREKLASLGHVTAGIAHEIRNPLSGININISALNALLEENRPLDDKTRSLMKQGLDMSLSASMKIDAIISRVLDFARPVPTKLDLLQVNEAVTEAVALSRVVMRKQELNITLRLNDGLPPCFADLQLIEQVVLNLITNAAQAMSGRPGPKEIEIASALEGDHVVIRVADSGPGIPESLREKIFEPHFTTKGGGTGLGLSFARRVMMEHGGFLDIKTSRTGGAEFLIGIPAGDKRKRPRNPKP